jgi:hypothetical protein
MPTAANVSAGAALVPSLNAKPINNPKTVTITPAKNGIIVQMQKTNEYGQDYAVAFSLADISKIIADYLTN